MTPEQRRAKRLERRQARKARTRKRILRSTAVLPGLFTISNGLFGFAAIHLATRHPIGSSEQGMVGIAAWLLLAAMACDMLDGRLARFTRRTSDFGIGLYTTQQVFYAAVSLDYHNGDPKDLDTTKLMKALQEKYSPFDYIDDTYFQCGFAHLDRYSAAYYTYLWALVIAKDLISKFDREGILNTRTARRFREMILEPGGSKKATDLVKDFLGRPYSIDAFEVWLNRT